MTKAADEHHLLGTLSANGAPATGGTYTSPLDATGSSVNTWGYLAVT